MQQNTGVALFFGKVNVLKRTRQRRGSAGKAKREGGKSVLPKLVFGRGSTSMEMRVRRFCFNYHVGECSETSDGGARGWHLCRRKRCFAPHAERDLVIPKRNDSKAASAPMQSWCRPWGMHDQWNSCWDRMRDGMLETDGKSECSHLLHMHVFQTGWMDSAEAGCKGSGFSDLFQSLGVSINVTMLQKGLVTGHCGKYEKDFYQTFDRGVDLWMLDKARNFAFPGALPVCCKRCIRLSCNAYSTWLLFKTWWQSRDCLDVAQETSWTWPCELRPPCNDAWFKELSCERTFAGTGALLFDPKGKQLKIYPNNCWKEWSIIWIRVAKTWPSMSAIFFAWFCAFFFVGWWCEWSGGHLHW